MYELTRMSKSGRLTVSRYGPVHPTDKSLSSPSILPNSTLSLHPVLNKLTSAPPTIINPLLVPSLRLPLSPRCRQQRSRKPRMDPRQERCPSRICSHRERDQERNVPFSNLSHHLQHRRQLQRSLILPPCLCLRLPLPR